MVFSSCKHAFKLLSSKFFYKMISVFHLKARCGFWEDAWGHRWYRGRHVLCRVPRSFSLWQQVTVMKKENILFPQVGNTPFLEHCFSATSQHVAFKQHIISVLCFALRKNFCRNHKFKIIVFCTFPGGKEIQLEQEYNHPSETCQEN